MRTMSILGAIGLLISVVATSRAEEVKSGVEVGGRIKSYSTIKCGGAEDGVKVGATLCYT